MTFIRFLQTIKISLHSLRTAVDNFRRMPREQILTAGQVVDALKETRKIAGNPTPQDESAMLFPYWNMLEMIGILCQCYPRVSDTIKEKIEIVLEKSTKIHGMALTKDGNRIYMDHIPLPNSKPTVSYRK